MNDIPQKQQSTTNGSISNRQKQKQDKRKNIPTKEEPILFITNPHCVCHNDVQNICDQVSRKRRNQFIQPFSPIYTNDQIEVVLSNKNPIPIIGLFPKIHRSVIDLNRNRSKNTFHFKAFEYLLTEFPNIILLDIHSYPKADNWGKKANKNTDLVILYCPQMNETQKTILNELKIYCKDFNIVLIPGGENTLINDATIKNHFAILLEFPDFGNDARANQLINTIYDFFTLDSTSSMIEYAYPNMR